MRVWWFEYFTLSACWRNFPVKLSVSLCLPQYPLPLSLSLSPSLSHPPPLFLPPSLSLSVSLSPSLSPPPLFLSFSLSFSRSFYIALPPHLSLCLRGVGRCFEMGGLGQSGRRPREKGGPGALPRKIFGKWTPKSLILGCFKKDEARSRSLIQWYK